MCIDISGDDSVSQAEIAIEEIYSTAAIAAAFSSYTCFIAENC